MIRSRAWFVVIAFAVAFAPLIHPTGSVGRAAETSGVKAGVGVVDATWHVGASAGQYAGDGPIEGEGPAHVRDPYGHSTRRTPSYGIQSRLSARAIVVEGTDGQRVAFVKNDLYIPQDLLNERVATILEEHDAAVANGDIQGPITGINHSNMMIAVTHNHSSPYYSSPSWGVWAFQDVFDVRFFEYLARRMADAVIEASAEMVPVRMGASVGYFDYTQRHSFGPQIADDGTPAGYPQTDNDHSIGVVRFDDVSDPEHPKPLANLVTLGQHPEFLEGNNLISGDYIAPMERMADAETGAVTVFAQNNTGTAEPDRDGTSHPLSARAEFSHREYAQAERGARAMADVIASTFHDIANNTPEYPDRFVPFSSDFPVKVNDKQFAPPYSHPYPSVSNCRTHEAAANGNPGVPVAGLPDCERLGNNDQTEEHWKVVQDAWQDIPPPLNPGATYSMLKENGVPIPENYSAPSYTGLQETFQVHLQAFRLGEVLITVCPCEQWSDQSLNIASRADKVENNMFLGYDWSAQCTENADRSDPEKVYTCPNPRNTTQSLFLSELEFLRIQAQVNRNALGWDAGFEACSPKVHNDGKCPLRAESEPANPAEIKGNYTHEELPPELGYDLVLPVGMANDYWGYIATYREYQRGDHYRKALTGLGAHSSDFLATRLMRMGGALKGGPDMPLNPLDTAYQVDGVHQHQRALIIGETTERYMALYEAQLPLDGGSPAPAAQPRNIQRFDAARFEWIGGSNYVDDPQVRVERLVDGQWVEAGDMSGEIVVAVDFPEGQDELAAWRSGNYEWHWSAVFEAFDSDIDTGRGNQTPAGTYRFVVRGNYRATPVFTNSYELESDPFQISRWEGITVPDIRLEDDGTVSFSVGPVTEKDFSGGYPGTSNVKKLSVGPIDYPDTWQTLPLPSEAETGSTVFPRLHRTYRYDAAADKHYLYCFSCTFRPWIDTGRVERATVTIERADGSVEELPAALSDGRWRTSVPIYEGDRAFVARAGIVDEFGEINGAPSGTVIGTLPRPDPDPAATKLSLRLSADRRYLIARLSEAESRAAIVGAPIKFFVGRKSLGTRTTVVDGSARIFLRKRYRPARFTHRARFAGNEDYLPSSDSR